MRKLTNPFPPGHFRDAEGRICDHLGPLARTWDDVSERARKAFGITPEEAARRAELRRKFDSGELRLPEHCGMLHARPAPSSSTGGTQPQSGSSLNRTDLGVASPSPTSPSRDTMNYDDGTASIQDHGRGAVRDSAQANISSDVFHPCSTSTSRDEIDPTHATPADLSATDVDESQTQNSKLKTQNSPSPEAVAEAVDCYTVTRAREYIAHSQKYTPWPHLNLPPEYITEHRHCPCGQPSPCPTHENHANGGPFPEIFWKLSPFSRDYAAFLEDRNLPYRLPKEFLA